LDALQSALRPFVAALNRQIRTKTPARALCRNLDGKSLAIRVRNTALCAYLRVNNGAIALSARHEGDPDVVISGSLLTLLRVVRSPNEGAIRDGELDLAGDARIAEEFLDLLKLGRPDPEEELSRLVGDVAAHAIGELVRDVGKWGSNAGATLRQNVSEYLQEEGEVLPRRFDFDRFRDRVETLRDDVARLDARLRVLEIQAGPGN